MPKRTSIVVVDDSVTIRAMMETVLGADGWLSVSGIASNAEEAAEMIDEFDPDVVTLDINMPGIDGLTLLADIMAHKPRPVIMLSSLTAEGAAIVDEAIGRGAVACFNKSLIIREADKLIQLIKEAGETEMPLPFIAAEAMRSGLRAAA